LVFLGEGFFAKALPLAKTALRRQRHFREGGSPVSLLFYEPNGMPACAGMTDVLNGGVIANDLSRRSPVGA